MTDVAIRCEHLSKQYRIGEQERYKALRDVITDAATSPFRRLRSVFDRQPQTVDCGNNGHRSSGVRHPSSVSGQSPTIWALDDVSFEVKRGEVVGIIGRNGAGKSTLLKILSRITKPTTGHAMIHGRVGSLLEVGTGFHPELTGRENIYLNAAILGMRKSEVERKFDEIVGFAEVEKFIDTPVKRYSSGMYVRLAFAVAAHMETEVLLVDEVLAVGDAQFQKKCIGKMNDVARAGRTVLFVSHNMAAISNLCTSGVALEEGKVAFMGTASEAVDFYNHDVLEAQNGGRYSSHIIFRESGDLHAGEVAIDSIEILDSAGCPKPVTKTWDDIVLRIQYSSKKHVERGSVVLEVRSLDGSRLMLLSTQPDGTLPITFQPGTQSVDCVIKQLPLAAGDYVIGGALAVPGVEYLWRRAELGMLTVVESDVYGSGLAPVTSRCLLAPHHRWELVNSSEPGLGAREKEGD